MSSAEPSTSSWTLESLKPEPCVGGPAPWKQERTGPLPPFLQGCPPLLIGGGVLGSNIHDNDEHLASQEPYRVFRLAMQYGLNAMDTSPFYHPSEITLGKILRTLAPEFPRESYYLITKVGRYGPNRSDFDYSPERIKKSIQTSLERLGTDYLDVALLHDVEFVSDQVLGEGVEGFHALKSLDAEDQFLTKPVDPDSISPADEMVLEAVRTLFNLKERGIVRNVGISGYPLSVLLRISRLVAGNPPYKPLDVILSYSNHTLQCDLLTGYREKRFAAKPQGSRKEWVPPKIMNASPFSMGLLTDGEPPAWHPAPPKLRQACKEASQMLKQRGSSLARTAQIYGIRGSEVREPHSTRPTLSTIVGLSTTEQAHQLIHSYRVLLSGAHTPNPSAVGTTHTTRLEPLCILTPLAKEKLHSEYHKQKEDEKLVIAHMKERQVFNWCWASPPALV